MLIYLQAIDDPDDRTRFEALLLKYYHGYSAAEIGDFLGTTAANVRQLIARAKKKLAAELAERGELV